LYRHLEFSIFELSYTGLEHVLSFKILVHQGTNTHNLTIPTQLAETSRQVQICFASLILIAAADFSLG